MVVCLHQRAFLFSQFSSSFSSFFSCSEQCCVVQLDFSPLVFFRLLDPTYSAHLPVDFCFSENISAENGCTEQTDGLIHSLLYILSRVMGEAACLIITHNLCNHLSQRQCSVLFILVLNAHHDFSCSYALCDKGRASDYSE